MSKRCYIFSHAVTRKVCPSVIEGLRAEDVGAPDFETFQAHHKDYCNALRSTGALVSELEPLNSYPDSVFLEDAALCLQEGVVIMRPGAPSRLGEAEAIRPELERFYKQVYSIKSPGFIEGGDILVTEREILVGRSARTNSQGISQLADIVAPWGYTVREVMTPPDVLHFKTDCSLLDEETILSTKRLARTGCFKAYRVIETQEGEEASANAIRFNDLVLFPAGFPKMAQTLRDAGYQVREIANSEAAKLDGGMSCLSLRFTPPSYSNV